MAQPEGQEGRGDGVSMPTRWREVWRMLAPWFGYGLFTAAGLLGLFTASGTADDASYAVGVGTFLLAALIVALRIKRQFDGEYVGLLLPMAPRSPDVLIVSIALLTLLALTGAVLAAALGGILYTVGLALFGVSVLLIFFDIKRYFDRQEGRC